MSNSPTMLSIETSDGAVRIAVYGHFSDPNPSTLGELLRQVPLVRSKLVIDVSKCTAISASGITFLTRVMQASVGSCELRVAKSGIVRELLEASGFAEMFSASVPY